MKLSSLQQLEYFELKRQYHERQRHKADLLRRKWGKPEPFLVGEYLVTGSNTLFPGPSIPQPTFDSAVARLNFLFDQPAFGQQEGIIWAPIALVRRGSITKLEVHP